MVIVYNKIDIKNNKYPIQYKKNYISALTGNGVSELKDMLKSSIT